MDKESNPTTETPIGTKGLSINDNHERVQGELSIKDFETKHLCSTNEAAQLKDAYLKMSPNCTHPLSICSAILTDPLENITTLTTRLLIISAAKQTTKPTQ